MEQGKKSFFEVGIFKQGDVVEQIFQKRYKISFRMYQELMWEIEFMGNRSALEFTFLKTYFFNVVFSSTGIFSIGFSSIWSVLLFITCHGLKGLSALEFTFLNRYFFNMVFLQ